MDNSYISSSPSRLNEMERLAMNNCCSFSLQAMLTTLTGAWVASCECARLTVGRWSSSDGESATSCTSSLSAPRPRPVSGCLSSLCRIVRHIPANYFHLPPLRFQLLQQAGQPQRGLQSLLLPGPRLAAGVRLPLRHEADAQPADVRGGPVQRAPHAAVRRQLLLLWQRQMCPKQLPMRWC